LKLTVSLVDLFRIGTFIKDTYALTGVINNKEESVSDSLRFFDPALDALAKKSEPGLVRFQRTLDETTADIRNLEAWLSKCNICIAAWVISEDQDFGLGWDRARVNNTFRLLCGSGDADEEGWGSERPLVEESAAMRLKARGLLPSLVQEIMSKMPMDLVAKAERKTAPAKPASDFI
jgi:hypothetical protein